MLRQKKLKHFLVLEPKSDHVLKGLKMIILPFRAHIILSHNVQILPHNGHKILPHNTQLIPPAQAIYQYQLSK